MKRNRSILVAVIVIVVASAAIIVVTTGPEWLTVSAAEAAPTATPSPAPENDLSFISEIFGGGTSDGEAHLSLSERIAQIVGRLLLAVILAGVLALRPRRNIRLFRRNLMVSQTEMLLALVGAALMMVVGDNAARAFGIFAAVSLVRFRTNIRDPKEITVLLLSLALGLAAGVGRWELGIALCLFALALLWLLEYKEPEQVFRSMELKVKTRSTDKLQEILKQVFATHDLGAEIREIDPEDEKHPVGEIVYYVNLPLNVSTDSLSDEIQRSGGENVESIEWDHAKHGRDIYE